MHHYCGCFNIIFHMLCFCIPLVICTVIASSFTFPSFIYSMRSDIPCFPGTTLARIIATSCLRLDSCSALSCLNPLALHTSCILIFLQHPSEKFFPLIYKEKALLKNSTCGPDTAIDGPGPSSKHTGCPNIVVNLGLMNLSTMAPLMFPRALPTVVANNVSKLSIINAFGGGLLPNFRFAVPYGNKFWCQLHFCPCQYCSVLGV